VQGRCRVGRAGSSHAGSLDLGAWLSGRAEGALPAAACGRELASPFLARTHTSEPRGTGKSAPEPAGPRGPLRPGRWVYEKGAGRAAAGGQGAPLDGAAGLRGMRSVCLQRTQVSSRRPFCGCELASPFLAEPIQMSSAGLGNPPQSPPARAGHCALVGGYMRKEERLSAGGMSGASHGIGTSPRQPSQAAVGPISYIAAFAWCPTVCRGADDCGEHHLSTAAAPALRPGGSRGIWEDSAGAREYPMCAEGWAMWVLGGSPDLYKATGGTYRLGKPQG
jgi:hypothetical protein